jgi:hypothetical protein
MSVKLGKVTKLDRRYKMYHKGFRYCIAWHTPNFWRSPKSQGREEYEYYIEKCKHAFGDPWYTLAPSNVKEQSKWVNFTALSWDQDKFSRIYLRDEKTMTLFNLL